MNTRNLGRWERLFSVALGLAGMRNGFQRGGLQGWLEVGASALMVKRGLSGHCRVKAALLERRADEAGEPAIGHEATPSAAARDHSSEERRVDNALEETFPASDPISP